MGVVENQISAICEAAPSSSQTLLQLIPANHHYLGVRDENTVHHVLGVEEPGEEAAHSVVRLEIPEDGADKGVREEQRLDLSDVLESEGVLHRRDRAEHNACAALDQGEPE